MAPRRPPHPCWSPGPLPAPCGPWSCPQFCQPRPDPDFLPPAAWRGRAIPASPGPAGTSQTPRTRGPESLYLGLQRPAHRHPPIRHPRSGITCCPHSPPPRGTVTSAVPGPALKLTAALEHLPSHGRGGPIWHHRAGLEPAGLPGSEGSYGRGHDPALWSASSPGEAPPWPSPPSPPRPLTPHSKGFPAPADQIGRAHV